MAEQVTNYQCPACTGPLHFSAKTGKLQCDYCGRSYDVAVIEQLYADREKAAAGTEPQWDASAAGGQWTEEEKAHMRTYTCPSCGAELICDDTTAATSCPYCGNPTVIPGRFSGALKPDYVIPFRMDKAAATEALKEYYRGKKLLPKEFALQNHIEEIKGIYVPFWLFDGSASADLSFLGTRVEMFRQGRDQVTVTRYFRVARSGDISFRRVPADASSKMPDAHMDSIEPFRYADIRPFSFGYLPGFLADKYDVDAKTSSRRVNERIRASTVEAFTATVAGYATLTPQYTDIRLKQGEVKYALLPVWLLSTKWKGKNFLFAMNGQTGKLIGDLPVSWKKFWAYFFGISLPLIAIFLTIALH